MSREQTPFSSDDVKVLARETRYRSFLQIDTLQLQHRLHEGGWSEPIHRELLVKTPAVGVLLYDPVRAEMVMVRQFRVGMLDGGDSPWPLELVAGLVDKDESVEQVARREVQEETGLQAADLIRICDYYNSPGASSERVSLFCTRVDASNAGGIHGLDHEHEDIKVAVISEAEAALAVESGMINNAMTLIALQWWFAHKDSVIAKWA